MTDQQQTTQTEAPKTTPGLPEPSKPSLNETLAVLGGGGLARFLDEALGEAAKGVMHHDGRTKARGKLVLELNLQLAAGGRQVLVVHKASYKRPTPTGDIAETVNGETPVYVNHIGALTLAPDNQGRLF
jgi:hypothetical protein